MVGPNAAKELARVDLDNPNGPRVTVDNFQVYRLSQ
jgi:hypothetical protein